ncbi:adenylosuccinate synthetase [Stomatobaculum longum]|uniref:adenylosuccinate synthetase n=1 Tax=Stomatobaculum longum TaxID=796942 RepID=UPI0028DB044C|nr:adenylosuccinate synthetase [Stomatobaculum longum]
MRSIAVIGKNFGDEGKGLAVASLSRVLGKPLIIKHNGGAQAGHTVEDAEAAWRFVHHQIGAGAEYGAPTLFAEHFMPDLYQLGKEVADFTRLFGFVPLLYSEKAARVTTIDDVLLNMGAEAARGDARHGSCGMGIDECVQRNRADHGLSVEEVAAWNETELLQHLRELRTRYTRERAAALGIDRGNPYFELLENDKVLQNYVAEVKANVGLLTLVDANRDWISQFEHLIFESGQGLLLDEDYEAYAPHLTSSKTGMHNPARFLEKRGLALDEAIYVTRSYVTRHGEGPLPCETERDKLHGVEVDLTNQPNEWQGTLRYARHESMESFFAPIERDKESVQLFSGARNTKLSILITHLKETGNRLYFEEGEVSFERVRKEGERRGIRCTGRLEAEI